MQQLGGNLETSPNSNSQQNSSSGQPRANMTREESGLPKPEPRPPRNARNQQQSRQQPQQRVQQQQSQQSNSAPADDNTPKHLDLASMFAPREDGSNPNDESLTDDDPDAMPESLEALSRRLKVKPEDLYNVKIQMPNGAEPVTLGYLKDRVGEVVDLETREMQFEQRTQRREGELLRAQAELRDVMSLLPKEVVSQLPQLVDKVRKQHESTRTREQQLTLEHIPEWEDESRRTADAKGMIAFLGEWGFAEGFLGTIVDHRAMKFIRDMYLRDQKIKKALANVTTQPKKGHRPSAKTSKPATKPGTAVPRSQRVMPDSQSKIMAFLNRDS